jgi:predicted RNA-binding protein with TRAM domain
MVNFNDVIGMLEKAGVADVLLPFILVFTIVFAVTEKIHLFSKRETVTKGDKTEVVYSDAKKFHGIIAMAMGFAVVIPHVTNTYPPKYDIVNIINQALPNVSVIIVAIVAMLVLLATFGVNFRPGPKGAVATGLWFAAIALIIYVFGSAAGWGWKIPRFLGFLNDKDTQALLIIALVFLAILNFIMKPSLTEQEKRDRRNNRKERWKNSMDWIYDYQE